MTADTGAQPALVARIRAAAHHPDPWFAALMQAFLSGAESTSNDDSIDQALLTRLTAKHADGPYTPPTVTVQDHTAPGPHGPVPVRVYLPDGDRQNRPLLVWSHGGGWVGGDLDMHEADATSREVCQRAGAVVVSVGYRLSVAGVHFPVPHDDVLAAYEWATARFGAGSSCFIGGASAGAALTAGVALRLRDEGRPPQGMLLLYPLVHPQLPVPSEELAASLSGLPDSATFRDGTLTLMVENYLGGPVTDATPYAMAGLGALAGLPPTLVINCEYDGLRASGEQFVQDLLEAGVAVTHLTAPDVLHGHINSPWLAEAQQTYADMASWLLAQT